MLPGVRRFRRQGSHLWFHALTRAALRRRMCSENVITLNRATATVNGQPCMPHRAACLRHTHTHTIPVRVKATVREGHGKLLQPNISIPSTTLQKPSRETSMSHIWPPETMINGKIPVQKIQFDHPSVWLGHQFVCEVLHNNSSSIFGMDTIHS